jgi:hypothetical protein
VSGPRRMASGTSAIGAIAPQIGRAERRTLGEVTDVSRRESDLVWAFGHAGPAGIGRKNSGARANSVILTPFFYVRYGNDYWMITVRHDNAWGVDVSGLSE